MSQDFAVIITLPPPSIPLHKLRTAAAVPVAPPVFPKTAASQVAPPAAPALKVIPGKKKERRMELAGLEAGDPRSTVHMLALGMKNAAATIPKLVSKYWMAILAVFAIWYGLHLFNPIGLSMRYPAMAPMIMFLGKISLFVVFLTATYNNFVAKAVYAALIVRVGLPLYGRVKSQGLAKVIADFKGIGPGLRTNWAAAEGTAIGLFIAFAGVAAFVSNFLTRNNKIDKIAVSLALAMALMKALSDGPKSLPFIAGRVMMKDFFVLLLKPSPVRNHHIYVAVSGLALGFLCLAVVCLAGEHDR